MNKVLVFLIGLLVLVNPSFTKAEGFEGLTELGISPSVTGMAIGGAGLLDLFNSDNSVRAGASTQVTVEVPSSPSITIENIYLYWSGVWWSNIVRDGRTGQIIRDDKFNTLPGCSYTGSRNIIVDGVTVTGNQIGCYRETSNIGWRHMSKTLRADITGLGRIGKGRSTLNISMPTGSMKMMGLSILVLYSDSAITKKPTVKVFDGIDFGYDSTLSTLGNGDPTNQKHFITPVVMQIPQSRNARNVSTYISVFDGGVGRHDITTISSGGSSRIVFYDIYQDADGNSVDVISPIRQTLNPREPVTPIYSIPAGATDLTYTFDSNCGPSNCNPRAGRSPSSIGLMFVGAIIAGDDVVTVPRNKRVVITK